MTRLNNRRDHYIPQGYLRGFIDPNRANHPLPLWYFDVAHRNWRQRAPKQIGHRTGFYDYLGQHEQTQTADNSFLELENTYPKVRQKILSDGFASWTDHRDFLLRYMQMMRVRSLLFFSQKEEEGRTLQAYRITEVGADGRTLKYEPTTLPDEFLRNRAVTEMRQEIAAGAAWMQEFNWALRYCDFPSDPFVTSEQPLIVRGTSNNLVDAMRDPEALVFFPLCWEACLVGSRMHFDVQTGKFCPQDMRTFRQMYRLNATSFVVSPTRLVEFDEVRG